MNKKHKFTINLFLVGIISFLLAGCVNDEDPDMNGGNISLYDKIPQFSVVMNSGETICTQSLFGKTGLIMFFNTNCPDCQKELPVIQQLWEKYRHVDDLLIVPVAREEGRDEILEYWSENNLTLPFSPQDNREVYSLFAKSIIPRIYISDRDGRVIFLSGDDDLPSLELLTEIIESQINMN